jgi:hypothetical protein
VPADVKALWIAPIPADVLAHPGKSIEAVVEWTRVADGRREPVRDRNEQLRQIEEGRRHEAHPFLAAVDPGPAVQKTEHRCGLLRA